MTDSRSAPPPGSSTFAHGEFSNATRYLCAAAYLDAGFMRRVLDEVVFPAHRGLPPSYGVDVAPVARHCLRARRRIVLRDALVSALFVVAMVVGPPLLVVPLAGLYLLVVVLRFLGGVLARDLARIVGALVVGVATWLLLQRASRRESVPTVDPYGLGAYTPAPDAGGGPTMLWLLVVTAAVVAVLAGHRVVVHHTVVSELQRARFSTSRAPAVPPWARHRMDYLARVHDANVTLYSESVTTKPFVGSGLVARAWSFAIPLQPARGPFVPSPLGTSHDEAMPRATGDGETFSAPVLYARLRGAIAGLATANLPEQERVRGLSIRDRLYVSGMLPETSAYLEPTTHLPVTRVGWDHVTRVATSERGPERHYQVTRISTWEGEVEISVFVYTAVQGSMLFLEFVATVLPSIRPEYHEIDAYERLGPGVAARCAGWAVTDLVRVAPMAPVHLVETALRAFTRGLRSHRERQSIAARLSYDYGARVSVREIAARQTPVFFQDLDANQRIALVERRVIASVVDTLEEFGLDPQEFGTRVTNLFNSTVISNSSVQNSAVASGPGAMARMVGLAASLNRPTDTGTGSKP